MATQSANCARLAALWGSEKWPGICGVTFAARSVKYTHL